MKVKRTEKILVMVNATADPKKKGYSSITFEDKAGNKFEYNFSAGLGENSRNKFFRTVREYEYIPLLQSVKNKPWIRVSFREGTARINPLTGKCIQRILYPKFCGEEQGGIW